MDRHIYPGRVLTISEQLKRESVSILFGTQAHQHNSRLLFLLECDADVVPDIGHEYVVASPGFPQQIGWVSGLCVRMTKAQVADCSLDFHVHEPSGRRVIGTFTPVISTTMLFLIIFPTKLQFKCDFPCLKQLLHYVTVPVANEEHSSLHPWIGTGQNLDVEPDFSWQKIVDKT